MGHGVAALNSAPSIEVDGALCDQGAVQVRFDALVCESTRWTVLLGASGVGKSTLLRVLAGLPVHWRFEGSITTSDGVGLGQRVGMMAQQDLLFPWSTVSENVALGARLRGERVDTDRVLSLIVRVGLADHADKRPGQLSGGQRQRVALARTLMEDRPVVVLDEPFSALDARTRSQMQDLSVELLQGRTVVMVTHDPAEAARLGHRIVLLKPGVAEDIAVPPGLPPRPVDDPDTLALQGRLLKRLREGD